MQTIKQIFEKGAELKELDDKQIKILSEEIPDWISIPAYISGFVVKDGLKSPIDSLHFSTPRKRKKDAAGVRQISKVVIEGGIGLFSYESVDEYPKIKELNLPPDTPVIIAGIGKEIEGSFCASSGLLKNSHADWKKIINEL